MQKKKRLLLAFMPFLSLAALLGGLYLAVGFQGIASEGSLKVVASFYPLAYMAEQIGGEQITVTCLIEPGVEAHSWQPSMLDIFITNYSAIVLYNGAGFDNWMKEDILPVIDLEGKIIVDTTYGLDLITNTVPTDVLEHGQYDPHTWVSPSMAIKQAEKIYQALLEADPENSKYYNNQWNLFKTKLEKTEEKYINELAPLQRRLFFTTHEAFGYIARDYNLTQYSIIGLSADQQPSTQTIADIVEVMSKEGVGVFYLEPGYSEVYVQVIKEELMQRSGVEVKILKLYHMNGMTEGFDYLDQMKENLVNLRIGLVG
jgi:zinc transport system substrate-binding protein